MKKPLILYFFLILIIFSCKKEKEEECFFSEDDFRANLAREWYVSGLQGGYYSSPSRFYAYSFDGDSTITIFGDTGIIYTTDPDLCMLQGIEDIEFWSITDLGDNFKIKTKNLCGDSNVFFLQYSNFSLSHSNCEQKKVSADIEIIPDYLKSPSYFTCLLGRNSYSGWDAISMTFKYEFDEGKTKYLYIHPYTK